MVTVSQYVQTKRNGEKGTGEGSLFTQRRHVYVQKKRGSAQVTRQMWPKDANLETAVATAFSTSVPSLEWWWKNPARDCWSHSKGCSGTQATPSSVVNLCARWCSGARHEPSHAEQQCHTFAQETNKDWLADKSLQRERARHNMQVQNTKT